MSHKHDNSPLTSTRQCQAAFCSYQIDGETLLQLTDRELVESLGVVREEDRRAIHKAVQEFIDRQEAADAEAAAAEAAAQAQARGGGR